VQLDGGPVADHLDLDAPSTLTIRSSGRRPARAAGLPATTSTTSIPFSLPNREAILGGNGREPPTIPM
jgi:hypothetical protein